MCRIFLADDHPPMRSALRLLIENQPDLMVVGEAGQADPIVATVAATGPDLILLDWHIVEHAGQGLVAALQKAGRAASVVALSCRPEDIVAANAAGVDAFVCMGEPPDHLLSTIRAVLASRAIRRPDHAILTEGRPFCR